MKWPTVKLKSVTSKVGSGATPRGGEAVYKDAGVPLIRSMNVHFDGFRRDGLVYIDEEEASLLNHVKIQSNDVLFNITGASIGRVTTAPADMAGARVNQHVCILRPTDKLMPEFLSYYMRSPDQQVLVGNNQIGGTRQAVTKGMLLNWEIYLPPLAEQGRIVQLLNEAGELQKLRAQADRRTGDLIPALFCEMFGENTKKPHVRVKLEQIAEVVSGVAKGRKFNGRLPVEVPYLRVANVQAGHLDLSEIKTIQALPEEVEELALRKGDVLLTEGGDFDKLGRGAMLEQDLPNCIHQNHVFRVRVERLKLDPVYFAKFLLIGEARRYFLGCAKRTTNLASINMTQLRALPVLLPPLTLQKEFAARVSDIRAMQAEQVASRRRLDDLFKSMLHRAFQGEL